MSLNKILQLFLSLLFLNVYNRLSLLLNSRDHGHLKRCGAPLAHDGVTLSVFSYFLKEFEYSKIDNINETFIVFHYGIVIFVQNF